jgi:hypothetical protein
MWRLRSASSALTATLLTIQYRFATEASRLLQRSGNGNAIEHHDAASSTLPVGVGLPVRWVDCQHRSDRAQWTIWSPHRTRARSHIAPERSPGTTYCISPSGTTAYACEPSGARPAWVRQDLRGYNCASAKAADLNRCLGSVRSRGPPSRPLSECRLLRRNDGTFFTAGEWLLDGSPVNNAHNRGYFVDKSTAAICWELVKAALGDLDVKI